MSISARLAMSFARRTESIMQDTAAPWDMPSPRAMRPSMWSGLHRMPARRGRTIVPYVHRNARGEIESLHRSATLDALEYLPQTAPEVQRFLGREEAKDVQDDFARLDGDTVRVLEDLLDVLLDKGLVRITDLPPAAQAKYFARKDLRDRQKPPAAFTPSGFVDIIDDSAFAGLGSALPPT